MCKSICLRGQRSSLQCIRVDRKQKRLKCIRIQRPQTSQYRRTWDGPCSIHGGPKGLKSKAQTLPRLDGQVCMGTKSAKAPPPSSSRTTIGRDALPVARTLFQPLTPPTLLLRPFPATLPGGEPSGAGSVSMTTRDASGGGWYLLDRDAAPEILLAETRSCRTWALRS